MKLVIVLCLAAVALARPQSDKDAEIISQEFELRDDQSYDSVFETQNNINAEESGVSYPGAEPETGSYVKSGSYEYTDPEGGVHYVAYIADEDGYQPESDDIPVFTGRVDIQDA